MLRSRMPVESGPKGYTEFERLVAEHPDEAWNLAFSAGRESCS